MFKPEESRLFSKFEGEQGVPVYIFDQNLAPGQQGFYFVNDSMSADGRYLWINCFFPPSQYKVSAVIDFKEDTARICHETQFSHATPYVAPESGDLYWGSVGCIWKRGPGKDDEVELVNTVPEDIVQGRPINHMGTHLTRSCDGKEFFMDMKIGLQYIFGTMPLDGGDFEHWHTFNRCHNHAQINPTDPDEVLFAQEFHVDPLTGYRIPITDRLWTMRRGEEPRPILHEPRFLTHESWDMDGKHVWAIDCGKGGSLKDIWRIDLATGEKEIAWADLHGAWHSHDFQSGKYIVADSCENGFYRGCPSFVSFYNSSTAKQIRFINNPEIGGCTGKNYHIDPHPRFCADGSVIVFTTTIRGKVDMAFVRTEDLVERTS